MPWGLFKNQRAGEERREGVGVAVGREQPEPGERRKTSDRRKLSHGVAMTTSGSISRVSDWLAEYCEGQFSVGLNDIDEQLRKKKIHVMFELETDKTKFVQNFSSRR